MEATTIFFFFIFLSFTDVQDQRGRIRNTCSSSSKESTEDEQMPATSVDVKESQTKLADVQQGSSSEQKRLSVIKDEMEADVLPEIKPQPSNGVPVIRTFSRQTDQQCIKIIDDASLKNWFFFFFLSSSPLFFFIATIQVHLRYFYIKTVN